MDYGFIITRHVNSEETNKYWNNCVKLIRKFYPRKKIVIIDDNSNQMFIKSEYNYNNITIIQSEYPGRGELLPYVYLLKYKWFKNAIIIHDSLFIHKRMAFEKITVPVLPLWHHPYDKENLLNFNRILSHLNNSHLLKQKLAFNDNTIILGRNGKESFDLCFGAQSYINLQFLENIEKKYRLTNLVNAIHNRPDRCSFERVIGLLFDTEYPDIKKYKSLFGLINNYPNAFIYNYTHYQNDLKHIKKVVSPFVKVWTGR
jgi:hypothetical protein